MSAEPVLPFDVERIVEACIQSGLPIDTNIITNWTGPEEDVLLAINPLLVEPLEHYGGPSLRWYLRRQYYADFIAAFYGLRKEAVESVIRALDGHFCDCLWCRQHRPLGHELRKRLIETGVLRKE